MDGRTDGPTDIPSCKDARTHLKRSKEELYYELNMLSGKEENGRVRRRSLASDANAEVNGVKLEVRRGGSTLFLPHDTDLLFVIFLTNEILLSAEISSQNHSDFLPPRFSSWSQLVGTFVLRFSLSRSKIRRTCFWFQIPYSTFFKTRKLHDC